MDAILFAAILKLTGKRYPHVALMFWISKPKKAFFLKRVHSHITTLVLWTSTHREFAMNRLGVPPEKIRFITYYVDQKFFRPMPRETDTICAVGQEMRDYPTLVEAMRGLDIKCHIAAGKSRGGRIFDTVKVIYEHDSLPTNVTVGPLNLVELRELYARSRFIVIPLLPTDSDNGLTSILEAMAMGKAVICSKTKGQNDVIIDGKTGIFVPQGNPKALREAIEYLWAHPEIAEKMGREGRKIIEEKFTWDKFVNNIKSFAEEATTLEHSHGKR
jgi:glycosyltransferase involved in cell wall biosynthesis